MDRRHRGRPSAIRWQMMLMPNTTERGVFATPRCPISTTCSRWRAISCAMPPTPRTPCRNAICGRCVISTAIAVPAMKPWLLTILRNVCNAEFARRGKQEIAGRSSAPKSRRPKTCRCGRSRKPRRKPCCCAQQDDDTIRRLVAELPQPFREAIVLREVNDLSYQRDCRGRRRAGRNGDVAAGARAIDAALGVERRGRMRALMNCAECEILLHALIDGELDAGHARDVEAHVATCSGCAEKLKAFRAMRDAMAGAEPERDRAGEPAQPHRGGAAVADGARHRAAQIRAAIAADRSSADLPRARRFLRPLAASLVLDRLPQRSGADDRRRSRVGAYPLAAGRPSDGRGNQRPAHGQAVVQRQARRRAAGRST